MRIRSATAADAGAILEIYNLEVLTSTVTFDLTPRTEEGQAAWLAARTGAYSAVVAEVDGANGPTVVGFGSLSQYRERAGYATTCEDSVYVHRDHQGTGVGSALLRELVVRATDHGFHTLMAKIVGGHAASIALHERAGFEVVGQEREVGRKFGRWLDVVLMQRMLADRHPD
ncbi:MAG: N-acetyltransferase family protein [Microthrixaceae bacterium]|nr:N-acetyltransferase [Microthrixaceae bacterium]